MRKILGSQRAAVEKTDELFPIAELGSQLGLGSQQRVKEAVVASDLPKKNTRKPLRRKRFQMVEIRRLELLTPYMRRKNTIVRIRRKSREKPC